MLHAAANKHTIQYDYIVCLQSHSGAALLAEWSNLGIAFEFSELGGGFRRELSVPPPLTTD